MNSFFSEIKSFLLLFESKKERMVLMKYFLFFLPFAPIAFVSNSFLGVTVAHLQGWETTYVHYQGFSSKHEIEPHTKEKREIYQRNESAIEKGGHFEEEARYLELKKQLAKERTILSLCLMFYFILVGSIGLLALIFLRKKNPDKFGWLEMMAVFLSLFWTARIMVVVTYLWLVVKNEKIYGPTATIAEKAGISPWLLAISLAIIGFLICWKVVFQLVPNDRRRHLILAGGNGGLSGFFLWNYWLGPLILPFTS